MEKPFYEQGLKFTCQRCSSCCRHSPGYVFLSLDDIIRLSAAFNITPEKFVDIYCRAVDIGGFTRLSLNEKKNYDCIFWESGGCTVYDSRPLQCISYPFWSSNLDSKENWNGLKNDCPGIDCGKVFSRQEIEDFLARRMNEPLL